MESKKRIWSGLDIINLWYGVGVKLDNNVINSRIKYTKATTGGPVVKMDSKSKQILDMKENSVRLRRETRLIPREWVG